MQQRKAPLRSVSVKKAEKRRMGMSDLKASGLVSKASEFTQKPRKALKPRSPKNKGGQVALFERIWESRPHSCEVCGARIGEPTASNFSHLLPKGSYPEYKLDERNVELWCEGCHNVWHNEPGLVKKLAEVVDGGWTAMWRRFCALRDEANGLTQEP